MAASTSWADAAGALAAPFFDGVRPLLRELNGESWPTLDQLNDLAMRRQVANARGVPIRFVPPSNEGVGAMQYETQIAGTGEVPTRTNWHDLFNALQWLAYPHLKSAINSQHARLLVTGGAAEAASRSAPRDVLTMFDESGVIVACDDIALLELIRRFQWRELFVGRREEVVSKVRFVLVGHGLLEKSLSPFVGMTAKAMLLHVDAHAAALDLAAAEWLMDETHLADSHQLAPLPLLGIPGWDARNEVAAFYDNTDYFRPGRRGR